MAFCIASLASSLRVSGSLINWSNSSVCRNACSSSLLDLDVLGRDLLRPIAVGRADGADGVLLQRGRLMQREIADRDDADDGDRQKRTDDPLVIRSHTHPLARHEARLFCRGFIGCHYSKYRSAAKMLVSFCFGWSMAVGSASEFALNEASRWCRRPAGPLPVRGRFSTSAPPVDPAQRRSPSGRRAI